MTLRDLQDQLPIADLSKFDFFCKAMQQPRRFHFTQSVSWPVSVHGCLLSLTVVQLLITDANARSVCKCYYVPCYNHRPRHGDRSSSVSTVRMLIFEAYIQTVRVRYFTIRYVL